MTIRAIALGLLLGLLVSAVTYFNDFVIQQTMLVGNHLPISVFGVGLLLLLGLNPLLRPLGSGVPLRAGEVALIVAIGLAACGWPGSGFYRGFAAITSLPQHWHQTKAGWQAADVMSYVPGGSAAIGLGHVQDWPALAERLQAPEPGSADAIVAEQLPPEVERVLDRIDRQGRLADSDRHTLQRAINHHLIEPVTRDGGPVLWRQLADANLLPADAGPALDERAKRAARREQRTSADAPAQQTRERDVLAREVDYWEQRANRAALAGVFVEVIMPAPAGSGVLVANGRPDPVVVGALLEGRGDFRPAEVPWGIWWPTLRLWGGLALLMGLAGLAMALIVHPQWSRHELLAYPIPRFIEAVTARDETSVLPRVARDRLFWGAFLSLIALHTVNGLHQWFPMVPEISRSFDFTALHELFPNAARVWGSNAYFEPTIYLSVAAFAFFLTTSVSFSVGIAQLLFLVLGSLLLVQGIPLNQQMITAEKANLLRFGAYVGFALMILYTGRRYYANVVAGAVGMPLNSQTPGYAVWAARGLVVLVGLAIWLLHAGGLSAPFAVLFVLLVLLMFLVISRIVAETGLFFIQPWWMPVAVISALFGMEAIDPTTFIVLAMASVLIVGDPREALMPYLTNGLRMAERSAGAGPTRLSPWLLVMVVLGFVVAGYFTLTLQYQHGLAGRDPWARLHLSTMPFDQLATHVSNLDAYDLLQQATAVGGMPGLSDINPAAGAVPWLLIGLVLVVGCAAVRLRLPWWPLHPVIFLVWGTHPIRMFAVSFLLGCLVKLCVVKTAGATGYHRLMPLMVGVIAGELTAGLGWMAVGAIYYFTTNQTPERYSIFPG